METPPKVFPPDDLPRPSRPKAGLGLVMMMMMMMAMMMMTMTMMMMMMMKTITALMSFPVSSPPFHIDTYDDDPIHGATSISNGFSFVGMLMIIR